MPISAKSARIAGALLIAILLVAGGYVLPGLSAYKTKPVNAELTDELLAAYVSKDTDGDDLPDWQESLYGTSVSKADTDNDGISDGEAVRRGLLTPTALASQLPPESIGEEDIPGESPAPGSITDQFSRAFFEAYIEASDGQPLSAEAQQALMENLIVDFNARSVRALTSSYTQLSVRTSASMSVRDYAASLERIIRSNDVSLGGQTPLSLMQAFMEQGDASAGQKLSAIATAESATARELLATTAPTGLASEHLSLLRSVDTLAKSTGLIAKYEDDPLGTMGALTAYGPASMDFVNALKGIAAAILREGEPQPGTPGAYIVEIARSAENL